MTVGEQNKLTGFLFLNYSSHDALGQAAMYYNFLFFFLFCLYLFTFSQTEITEA